MQIYKATIYNVNSKETPITVDIKKYNFLQQRTLPNGIVLDNDPLIKNIIVYNPCGYNYCPKVGDKVEVIIDDDGFSFCFPFDTNIKPLTTTRNPILGNFDTNNILKFTDNEIIISNRKDDADDVKVYINTDIINLKATNINITGKTNITGDTDIIGNINLGDVEGAQPVAIVGSTVEVNITKGSSAGTYQGTITSGCTKVKGI